MNLLKRPGQRPVNLDNVSTIFIDSNRVIFHFNTNRTVQTRNGLKNVPDYLYWDLNDNDNIEFIRNDIESVLTDSWISPKEDHHRYINLDAVTNIGFDDYKQKVIFNFNFSVSHPYNQDEVIGGFEFWNFNDSFNYNETKNYLEK